MREVAGLLCITEGRPFVGGLEWWPIREEPVPRREPFTGQVITVYMRVPDRISDNRMLMHARRLWGCAEGRNRQSRIGDPRGLRMMVSSSSSSLTSSPTLLGFLARLAREALGSGGRVVALTTPDYVTP